VTCVPSARPRDSNWAATRTSPRSSLRGLHAVACHAVLCYMAGTHSWPAVGLCPVALRLCVRCPGSAAGRRMPSRRRGFPYSQGIPRPKPDKPLWEGRCRSVGGGSEGGACGWPPTEAGASGLSRESRGIIKGSKGAPTRHRTAQWGGQVSDASLDAFDVDDCEWFISRWEDQILALQSKLDEARVQLEYWEEQALKARERAPRGSATSSTTTRG
jgi:hypothetical protein